MLRYKQVLQPGEAVRYIGSLHWVIYKWAIMISICMVVLDVLVSAYLKNPNGQWPFLLVPLAMGVLSFIPPWFKRATTEIVVTDKRIIHKVGWISHRTEEMSMTKVDTVNVSQAIMGRLFGFGTVLIIGASGSWEPLAFSASPLDLRNAIMVGLRNRLSGASSTGHPHTFGY